MKEIINIIVIRAGLLEATYGFILPESGAARDKAIKAAENMFEQEIRKAYPGISESEIKACIDDGIYDDPTYDIYLNWSDAQEPDDTVGVNDEDRFETLGLINGDAYELWDIDATGMRANIVGYYPDNPSPKDQHCHVVIEGEQAIKDNLGELLSTGWTVKEYAGKVLWDVLLRHKGQVGLQC